MKILIADDDTTSRLVLAATLQKLGHDVVSAENGRQALDRWRQHRPALLISDWIMPELDGLQVCRSIRDEAALQYTYIILLTSLEGKGRYLDGMQSGADDFISKPFDEDTLAARLHAAQRILALHEALRVEATHDRLTGLWNRGAIMDAVQLQLRYAAENADCVGVILIDLDRFKSVNDKHGHATGDRVLREAAGRMRACLDPGEYLGRYGGEEFLIVAPGCEQARLLTLAQTIRARIATPDFTTDTGPLPVTISLGMALSQPGAPEGADALISAADVALYRAKQGGRNRVEVGGIALVDAR